VRPMPPVYATLAKSSYGQLRTPLPFGSTRLLSAKRPDQMVKTVSASVNGKAFAVPPHGLTPGGKRFFSPPLTGNPTLPNKQNPIYARQNVASPPAPGQAMSKPLPAFQPDKAPPAPMAPLPLPTDAPHDPFVPSPPPRQGFTPRSESGMDPMTQGSPRTPRKLPTSNPAPTMSAPLMPPTPSLPAPKSSGEMPHFPARPVLLLDPGLGFSDGPGGGFPRSRN